MADVKRSEPDKKQVQNGQKVPRIVTTLLPKTTVAIVGSAGRNEDAKMMNKDVFRLAYGIVKTMLRKFWNLKNEEIVLVSGGSAWIDHLAVLLFLDGFATNEPFGGLQLYLPCCLVKEPKLQFDSSPPGQTLNALHREFGQQIGRNTFKDILTASAMGAKISSQHAGFKARNVKVAKCQRMIALTWGDGHVPKEGSGTRHTWDCCQGIKQHIPLKAASQAILQSESST